MPGFYARSWSDLKIFRQRDPFRGMLRSIQPEVGRFKVQPVEASKGVASEWGRIVRSKGTSGSVCLLVRKASSISALIFLGILALAFCSCAGFKLPPEEQTDNRPRIPGSGDIGE